MRIIATIKTSIMVNDMMSQQFRAMNMAMSTVIHSFSDLHDATGRAVNVSALEAAQRELNQVESNFNQIEQEIRQSEQAQDRFNREVREGSTAANGLMKSLWGMAGAYLTFQSAKGILGLSDEITTTAARLDLMNDGLQTTEQLQQMIFDSAMQSRGLYQQTADAVAKLGMQASDAFSSNQEVIAFAEQLNKTFVVAGTSAQGIESVMLQLTQAMAAGKLQGEELNAVLDNAQPIVQNIADYMDVSVGSIKKLASEGQITADIIKNAMFAAAEETNAKFESMPYTFAQVWNLTLNNLYQTFEPLLQIIGHGAQFIYDNWSTLEPIFWGLTAAVGSLALMWGLQTAATWLATEAAHAFFIALLKNPIMWIALAIGVLVGMIYNWVQSVGGLEIAWAMAMNGILTGWDMAKIGFFTGVYWVLDLMNKMQLGFMMASTGIQNIMGDMRVGVLLSLQHLVNGAIGIINDFIRTLNQIPGVSIDLVQDVTFGTNAALANVAARSARNADLADYALQTQSKIAARQDALSGMRMDALSGMAQRSAEIAAMQVAKASQGGNNAFDYSSLFDEMALNAADTAGNTKKMADSIDMAAEDLAYLKDMADQTSINRVTNDIKINVKNENSINSELDIDGVIDRFSEKLEGVFDMTTEGAPV